MPRFDLATEEGLRAARESIEGLESWAERKRGWVVELAEALEWVRKADESERTSREFQQADLR